MLRTLARFVFFAVLGVGAVAGILYAAGLRLAFGGGGDIRFAFTKSAETRAAEIEKHREAQRAQVPPPAAAQPDAATHVPPTSPNPETPGPTTDRASIHWTGFRGPDRDGHYRQQPVRTDWGSALAPLWKQPVGSGYASFVVAEGRAFTVEQRGGRELAAAYDLVTGRELWTSAWNARFESGMGGDGPRATPAWDRGRLYVVGATGEFRALDAATGRTLWHTNALADAGARNIEHGMSASPLVVDSKVVLLPGVATVNQSWPTTANPGNASGARWTMARRIHRRCSSLWQV